MTALQEPHDLYHTSHAIKSACLLVGEQANYVSREEKFRNL